MPDAVPSVAESSSRWRCAADACRRWAGPLLLPLVFALGVFALLTLARVAWTLLVADRALAAPDWPWLFLVGVRMDSVLVCMLLAPAFLVLLTVGSWRLAPLRWPMLLYATAATGVLLFMELATPQFLAEFDHRPDRIFWEYLRHPREVGTTLLKTGWPSLIAAAIAIPLALWAAWRWHARVWAWTVPWPRWWIGPLLFLPMAAVTTLGIRGTLSHRPVNVSTAAFSNENLLNQLALNSTYSAAYALYALRHEADTERLYGAMEFAEAVRRVRAATDLPATAFLSATTPTWHRVQPDASATRPRNLVIILQESLGAQYVGCLGGLPLTPNLDAFAKEGLLLTRLYATGTRTVRGIEAVFSGLPPTPAMSVVKLGLSQKGFFTVADALGRAGHETLFFYGGESHFDNMRSFFQGNGVQRIVDQPHFREPAFLGTWGVSDEDLARRAADDLAALNGRPFAALLLSTSNHEPFEYPEGRITPFNQPARTRENAIHYADYAIGEFVRRARGHAYWKDTVVMVVSDHNVRTVGDSLLPVRAFHIVAAIVGPGFAPGTTYDRVCSQLDLMPTILPRLGVPVDSLMIGHDLLARPATAPGRAIMQFADAHGYRVGDRMVVHLPNAEPRAFTLGPRDEPVPSAEVWPELEAEARAHAVLPAMLYRMQRYRIP